MFDLIDGAKWSSLKTYAQNEFASRGGFVWKSKVNGNIGNDPSTDTSRTNWVEYDGNPNRPKQASSFIYPGAVTIVPSGANFTLDCGAGDMQKFAMLDSTCNVLLTNPHPGAFTLIVDHHSNSHSITFPASYFLGTTYGAQSYSLIGGAYKTIFNLMYDGTSWYITYITFQV